ncbi:hypothetical protein MY1884_003984 [Beauveria asiatica]|uniref:Uncharacterized protein n=1 Tax=Beauveria bassiana D1-5 TaxID=1245745 RepID=A0A0A2V9V3_BEABA|nr:hypothetical protein BBAD15_g11912 [Beauveria bassiana D1-5]
MTECTETQRGNLLFYLGGKSLLGHPEETAQPAAEEALAVLLDVVQQLQLRQLCELRGPNGVAGPVCRRSSNPPRCFRMQENIGAVMVDAVIPRGETAQT